MEKAGTPHPNFRFRHSKSERRFGARRNASGGDTQVEASSDTRPGSKWRRYFTAAF